MPHRANGPFVMFVICLLGLFIGDRPATAEVTRIEFASKQPYGTFGAGEYVIWQGRIHGDLSLQALRLTISEKPARTRRRSDQTSSILLQCTLSAFGLKRTSGTAIC